MTYLLPTYRRSTACLPYIYHLSTAYLPQVVDRMFTAYLPHVYRRSTVGRPHVYRDPTLSLIPMLKRCYDDDADAITLPTRC
jgi:hypothetical protein